MREGKERAPPVWLEFVKSKEVLKLEHLDSYKSLQWKKVVISRIMYRKIPKISPRAYIFQRPFLRGLFLEGLIFWAA